jgi:hypothetical protein
MSGLPFVAAEAGFVPETDLAVSSFDVNPREQLFPS